MPGEPLKKNEQFPLSCTHETPLGFAAQWSGYIGRESSGLFLDSAYILPAGVRLAGLGKTQAVTASRYTGNTIA